MFSLFYLINAILVASIFASPVDIVRRDEKVSFDGSCRLYPNLNATSGKDLPTDGTVIYAECNFDLLSKGLSKEKTKVVHKDLNDCVTNSNGVLKAVPKDGGYSSSCENCIISWSGLTFYCDCLDGPRGAPATEKRRTGFTMNQVFHFDRTNLQCGPVP